jgi:hypothetical protein
MNTQELIDTARTLVADDKGLLAMDGSNPTCNKRFAKLGILQTLEARCAYRELMRKENLLPLKTIAREAREHERDAALGRRTDASLGASKSNGPRRGENAGALPS